MTKGQKIFALFVAINGAVSVAVFDRSWGLSLITFCSILTLFIAMSLTGENE